MDRCILVLDKLDYKSKEKEYKKIIKEKYAYAEIFYTKYEDAFIRFLRNLPKIGKLLHHIAYWTKSFIYALQVAKIAKKGATVICVNPLVAIFLSVLNGSKSFKLVMCGFLFENKSSKFYYSARKKFVNLALKGIDKIIVYAQQEVSYYEKIFNVNNKFKFVQYGIDYDENESYKNTLPKQYLFSGGGSNRDYETLFAAYHLVHNSIDIPLCVATLPYCVAGMDTTDITLLYDVVLETFGSVMKNAEVVILSLKDTEISAGHQVMLQALSEGCPVIVNRIKSIEDYVTENNVIFFESENAKDLAEKIKLVYNDLDYYKKLSKGNIAYYETHYRFNCLLGRLINMEL